MIYRRVDIFIQHRTEGRLADEVSWMIRKVDVVDLCEDEVGDWGGEGDGPAEDADDGGPLDVWEGEDVERGADGEVALQGEREDRQHGGVRGAANDNKSDELLLMKSLWRIWIGGEIKSLFALRMLQVNRFSLYP